MSAVPKQSYSLDEYLALERIASCKNEYYRGQIFAMSGGSPRHNTIGINLAASLRARLRGSPCRPYNSDQRIHIPAIGLSTYPDLSIVCGELKLDSRDRDAIVNPRVIVEVLSRSTERYDRGKKFDFYRQLEPLLEYVLVNQDDPQVERFVRQEDGNWLLSVYKGLDAKLDLVTIDCVLPLMEIYEDVKFGPEEIPPPGLPSRPSPDDSEV
jgi:Uma2 family endonuclease